MEINKQVKEAKIVEKKNRAIWGLSATLISHSPNWPRERKRDQKIETEIKWNTQKVLKRFDHFHQFWMWQFRFSVRFIIPLVLLHRCLYNISSSIACRFRSFFFFYQSWQQQNQILFDWSVFLSSSHSRPLHSFHFIFCLNISRSCLILFVAFVTYFFSVWYKLNEKSLKITKLIEKWKVLLSSIMRLQNVLPLCMVFFHNSLDFIFIVNFCCFVLSSCLSQS